MKKQYLPLQHAVLGQRIIIVGVRIFGYQRTFGVKSPSFRKLKEKGVTLNPRNRVQTAVLEVLYISLALK